MTTKRKIPPAVIIVDGVVTDEQRDVVKRTADVFANIIKTKDKEIDHLKKVISLLVGKP